MKQRLSGVVLLLAVAAGLAGCDGDSSPESTVSPSPSQSAVAEVNPDWADGLQRLTAGFNSLKVGAVPYKVQYVNADGSVDGIAYMNPDGSLKVTTISEHDPFGLGARGSFTCTAGGTQQKCVKVDSYGNLQSVARSDVPDATLWLDEIAAWPKGPDGAEYTAQGAAVKKNRSTVGAVKWVAPGQTGFVTGFPATDYSTLVDWTKIHNPEEGRVVMTAGVVPGTASATITVFKDPFVFPAPTGEPTLDSWAMLTGQQ